MVVNPRLSDREIDLIREHSGARRVFYTIEVSDATRQHAERQTPTVPCFVELERSACGPLNRETVSEPVEVDRPRRSRRSSIPRARRQPKG